MAWIPSMSQQMFEVVSTGHTFTQTPWNGSKCIVGCCLSGYEARYICAASRPFPPTWPYKITISASSWNEYRTIAFLRCLTLCGRMSLICGPMSPITTTPTYQLAIKALRSTTPSGKSPECHPYYSTKTSVRSKKCDLADLLTPVATHTILYSRKCPRSPRKTFKIDQFLRVGVTVLLPVQT